MNATCAGSAQGSIESTSSALIHQRRRMKKPDSNSARNMLSIHADADIERGGDHRVEVLVAREQLAYSAGSLAIQNP